MNLFNSAVVLLALCSVGISALENITITSKTELRSEFNHFLSKSEAKFLFFDHVIVESIAEDSFNEYTNIRIVYFDRNGIARIPGNLFKYNSEVRFVTIMNNLLTNLPPNTFAAMRKLVGLTFTHNRLNSIGDRLFANNGKLVALGLQSNRISAVHPKAFANLVNLKMLYLSNNRLITLPENIFANNRKLEKLNLNNNNFKVLSSPAFFANNPKLKELNLGENLLQRFDLNMLRTNSKLENLLMRRNELVELVNYEQSRRLFPKLRNFVLSDNFFKCSYYSKVDAVFASADVNLEYVMDPTSIARIEDMQAPEPCIPDAGYNEELARRSNVGYNKLDLLEVSIEDAKQSLYEMEHPPYSPSMVTNGLYAMVQDVDNCLNDVDGFTSLIMESCDNY